MQLKWKMFHVKHLNMSTLKKKRNKAKNKIMFHVKHYVDSQKKRCYNEKAKER